MSGRQQEMVFRTWGGKRKGAGRKRIAERPQVPHAPREKVNARHPVLVTTRVAVDVGRLRRPLVRAAIRDALAMTTKHMYANEAFRICQLSIQGTHLHLIAEADSNAALSRGMKGFLVSCARRINTALGRRGQVFAGRFHASSLATPRQVRNALSYVLCNWRKHGDATPGVRLDPYSSAVVLADWSPGPIPRRAEPLPVALPRTWLLAEGWRRAGPISPWTRPGAS
jgi:putative transposase